MKHAILSLLLLFSVACNVQQPATVPAPVVVPVATIPVKVVTLEKSCPAKGAYGTVDVSDQLTQTFLHAMRGLGVGTVFRYYDYPNETIKGKTLTTAEVALLKANGMQIGVVFQHNNRWENERTHVLYHTFDGDYANTRGTADAKRSVELAVANGQPKGSAIFYGVDFDPNSTQMQNVLTYAKNFAAIVRAAGYKVGAYGSGDTLTKLKAASLVDFTWVSQSRGFSGTAAYTAANKWDLLQFLPKDCGGLNVDFDTSRVADFGQWTAK